MIRVVVIAFVLAGGPVQQPAPQQIVIHQAPVARIKMTELILAVSAAVAAAPIVIGLTRKWRRRRKEARDGPAS